MTQDKPTLRRRLFRLGLTFVISSAIGAVFTIGNLSFRTVNVMLHPRRLPVTETPAVRGLPYEDVSFASADGTMLRGWFIPGRDRAAVVLAHGLGANRATMLETASWLWERGGFSVVAFDLRASGDSGGDTTTFGYH